VSAALRLVIFDVDGTLVDSQDFIVAAMEQAFASEGLQAPERGEILSIVGLSLDEAVGRLSGGLRVAAIVAAYRGAFLKLRQAKTEPLYPGVPEMLAELAKDETLLLGVATGKARRGLDHILDTYNLRQFFVTSQVADDHPSKPNPSMVDACMRDTGVAAANTVIIGDTVYDIEMGRAAGIRRIGVSWGYHPAEDLIAAGAARVVDEVKALPAAIAAQWET
jgi:phosphoglycolate phosphatase